jgi:hypothetical protein
MTNVKKAFVYLAHISSVGQFPFPQWSTKEAITRPKKKPMTRHMSRPNNSCNTPTRCSCLSWITVPKVPARIGPYTTQIAITHRAKLLI